VQNIPRRVHIAVRGISTRGTGVPPLAERLSLRRLVAASAADLARAVRVHRDQLPTGACSLEGKNLEEREQTP
jgi:hypothetical protein